MQLNRSKIHIWQKVKKSLDILLLVTIGQLIIDYLNWTGITQTSTTQTSQPINIVNVDQLYFDFKNKMLSSSNE